jgi:hypothetical protein
MQLFSFKRHSHRWIALTHTRASADSGNQRMSPIRETLRFADPAKRELGATVHERATILHHTRTQFAAFCLSPPFPLNHHSVE